MSGKGNGIIVWAGAGTAGGDEYKQPGERFSGIAIGTIGFNQDGAPTGNVYHWNGYAWIDTGLTVVGYIGSPTGIDSKGGSAVNMVITDTVTVKQEIEVSTYTENDRITIVASTNPVETWDISWADEVTISCATGGAETIKIEVSLDGSNYSAISPVGRDSADGAYKACSALANKMVTIPFNAKKMRFTASAGVETHTVDWSARNSGRGAV